MTKQVGRFPKERVAYEARIIAIDAGDWLREPDVQEWIKKSKPAHWPDIGDVFIYFETMKTGEGSDDPNCEGGMPMWLHQNIRSVLYDFDVDPSAKIFVKLCNVED